MVGLWVVVALALVFNYTNGFHDAANAIASAVSTRAMPLRWALAMGAAMNLVGALLSTGVAVTVAEGVIKPPPGTAGLAVVLSAVVGATVWNLATWYFGLPSSSSHALIGGLVGAAIASASQVHWSGVVGKVVVPMILSPLVGLLLGYLVMTGMLWAFRRSNAHKVGRGFRRAQIVSAAALALGHGLQDAQKSMGVIVLALTVTGVYSGAEVPFWVVISCAAAMAAGSYSGGLRVMRTLGRRVFPLTPPHGFAAELSGAAVLYVTAFAWAAPISTTHVMTTAIMGVGATRRPSAVRWGIAGNIVTGWVLTLPAAALVSAIVYWPAHAALG